jgi:predicted RND superfamily exporter protein
MEFIITHSNGHDHVDRGLSRVQALRTAFGEVAGPIMLTSLTTTAGFQACLTTHVKPYREMGIYVALGVLYATANGKMTLFSIANACQCHLR